ncbi:MAG: hypothetical protein B6229_07740 [Spirochaetaceae bacterium 4572_7]|nr:MAG: hypothetical protein B6229_07740 [Spirochaetaceae bacterium 4572_7]
MTIKSYYANNRIYDFEANIINITQENEDFLVELDSTYFYPEGGGQPSDKGTIGGVRVLDVIKSDDTVLHKLKTRPSKTTLNCSINKEHRDHYMTQHSGQHLISGVLKHSLNIDTLSVHLGEYETTIEIDKASISESEITKLEDDCNALIRSSKNIIYHETDDDGLKEFNIRRSSKYSGYIRVVEIENYDFVPCGGVHLSNLSEICNSRVKLYSLHQNRWDTSRCK